MEIVQDQPAAAIAGDRRVRCRPIFILGVDRSGSSLVSELTYSWGANAGDLNLLAEGNDGNPQGYWEYQPMEEFLDRLVRATKVSMWHPQFPERLRQLAADPAFRSEARQLMSAMEGDTAWFWKEPYLCMCLPFFTELLVDPIFIVTIRNPYESAISYEKFELPSIFHGIVHLRALFLFRWQNFMLSVLGHLARHPSTLYIPYDRLLRQPQQECDRLCAFLDRECGVDSDRSRRVAKMTQVVDPSLWRNRSDRGLDEIEQATSEQRDLYRHLLQRVDEPLLPFERERYPLPSCSREYLDNVDVMLTLLRKL